jgi:hypothetical protein
MQFLDSLKEVRGIYARWLNFIQGFEFTVVHRPGVKNQNADPISQMERMSDGPSENAEEEKADQDEDVYQIMEKDVGDMRGNNTVARERPSAASGVDVGQIWGEAGQGRVEKCRTRIPGICGSVRVFAPHRRSWVGVQT